MAIFIHKGQGALAALEAFTDYIILGLLASMEHPYLSHEAPKLSASEQREQQTQQLS